PRREDLLPAVVPLERRQIRRADEALRPIVEARLPRRGREALDDRLEASSQTPEALCQQVGGVRVVAAEQLVAAFARERDFYVLRGELGDQIGRQRARIGER